MHEDLLVDYLPKAGLIFPARLRLLSNGERDAVVSGAFRAAGMIVASPTKAEFNRGRANVEEALVNLFAEATNEAYKPLIQHGEALDFESTLRENTLWAKGDRIGDSIFAELFHALVNARLAWVQNPRFPFNPEQHCALAREIEKFLAFQESWGRNQANMAFFEIAGGFVDEDSAQRDNNEGGPVTGFVDVAGVAAPAAADDQGDVRALIPQFSGMDIDDEDYTLNDDNKQDDEKEDTKGQIADNDGDDDAMMID